MKKYVFLIFSFILFIININVSASIYFLNIENENIIEPTIKLTSLSLNKKELTLEIGKSETLIANKIPANSDEKLIWTSSNNNVVKVENGKLTALIKGTAVITVENENKTFRDTCNVIVKEKEKEEIKEVEIKVKSIELNKTSLSLKIGDEYNLRATVLPSNASNKDVIWESSNTSVVKVENGKLTALKKGNAIITVKSQDKKIKTTCNVVVNEKEKIELQSIYLNKKSLSLTIGETITLQANVLPTRATNIELVWKSNNDVVKVENGIITALKKGTSVITVSNKEKTIKTTCTIVVNEKKEEVKEEIDKTLQSIVLNKESVTMYEGNTVNLSASVIPYNSTYELLWKSSNENIVKVEDGKVTALKKGNAIITVFDKETLIESTCNIKVLRIEDEEEKKLDENDFKLILTIALFSVVCIGLYLFNKPKKNSI